MDARKLYVLLLSCAVPTMLKPEYVSSYHGFFPQLRRYARMIRSKKETFLERVDDKSLYCGV